MKKKNAADPDLGKYINREKREYITYQQGAEMFEMPYWSFVNLVKEAGANFTLRRTAMVDVKKLNRYLDQKYLMKKEKKEESERERIMRRKQVENIQELKEAGKKKYVRYEEGAKLYSMGVNTFRELAKDAGALYKVKRIVLVNTEKFEAFLETFSVDPEEE